MKEPLAGCRILVADDQPSPLEGLIRYLQAAGALVRIETSVPAAKIAISEGNIDIALVDIDFLPFDVLAKMRSLSPNLPPPPEEGAGYKLTRWVRDNFPDTWIVVMSAHRIDVADQIAGFDNGGDAFFEKVRGPALALSVVTSVLGRRRSRRGKTAKFRGFCFDLGAHILRAISGEEVPLTDAEFRLLEALISSPGKRQSRSYLHESAFLKPHDGFDRAVDTLVLKLRKKLVREGASDPISSVHGYGYRFEAEVQFEQ